GIGREIGFAGGAVDDPRIPGMNGQRAYMRIGPLRPGGLPVFAAVAAAPDASRCCARIYHLVVARMDGQRGGASRDVEWPGCLPAIATVARLRSGALAPDLLERGRVGIA